MKIEIFGAGCPKCRALYENACKAVEEANVEADIVKIEDVNIDHRLWYYVDTGFSY